MSGVTVFGSANADLVFPVPDLPGPGHTVLGGAWRAMPGGKGANQAVAAARDGAAVRFFGAVGRDAMAAVALSAMREAGVDLSGLSVVEAPTGAAAICVDAAGRNQIAVSPGANAQARAASVPDDALRGILLMQMEVPAAEIAALLVRGRTQGARIILNLAPAVALGPIALRAAHLVVVNEHEAAWLAALLGCCGGAAPLHHALGTAVVVTRGAAGADAAADEGVWHVPAHPATAVLDTTGAGDCWCGVLAAAWSHGVALPAAMRRAAVAAGIAVSRAGAAAGMPHAAEIDAALTLPRSGA